MFQFLTRKIKLLFIILLLISSIEKSSAQVNLTNGLVAQYNFSGNSNDVSGNNRHGQAMNGVTLTTDRFGNSNSAYSFDGVNDYIRVPDNGGFSTSSFSLALWFQSETDALQNLVGKRDFTGGNNGAQYQFFINYPPFPGIGSNIVGNSSNCSNVTSSSYINTGNIICKTKWYFVVIVFEGIAPGTSRHRIYIDGVLRQNVTAPFSGMLTTCLSELRFGNWWSGDLIPFKGKMDDIRWYNRPLNQDEVNALYDNFPTSSSADFNYTQNSCNPKTIQFSNVTPGTTSVFWDFGNNTTNTGNANPTVTYANYGNYNVKLRVQTSSGCLDSVTKTIPVIVQQDSLITRADTTICRGSSVPLNTFPALNFCWGTEPGLSNTNIANPVAAPQNTTTYYFTSQSIGNNLVVNGDFSNGNSGFTSDYTPQFPNTTQGVYWVSNNSFAWNVNFNSCTEHTTGTGSMMMVNGSPLVGAKVWSQTVTVTPNTNYAFSTWIQSLAALNPARLRFSINGNVLGNNINAGNVACQWSQFYTTWNSGNNTSAIITIVNNNTIADGNDFAIDDISFAQVFLKQDSIKITVTDPPAIDVTPNISICPGESITLNAIGATNFTWSPVGGLSNSTVANPVATPTTTTKYIVTGYDLPGCSGKDSVTITMKSSPVITADDDTSFCVGSGPVVISATAPNAAQYSWTPTAGLSDPSISNPSANPSATNKYYIEVTGTNGCKSIDSITVSVLDVPVVDTRSDTSICSGVQTLLTTTATGATSYSWSPVSGLSNASIANPLASPTVLTKYILTVSNGACSAKDSVTIDIKPSPVVSKSSDTTICNDGQAQLSANGGVTYNWSPSTGLNNVNISNPVASPNAATKYFVTVTGVNGCNKIDSINVGWTPKPVFTITPSAIGICKGNSTALTASGADVYNWFAGSNITSPTNASTTVQPATTQQFSVAVHHNFCSISDTLHSIVTVNDRPAVTVSKSNDIDCSNGSTTLTATGGVSYSWSPQINITAANTANPTVTPAESTTYVVRVTNAAGCEAVDSVNVLVAFNPVSGGYNMPNAFTPNNDGKNDCFGIKYWGVVQNLNFSIYNRWGERIFVTTNDQKCWDGTYKGIAQPSGTYVYQIKATTACGDVFKKGTVVLMR